MSKTIQIRGVPDSTHAELRSRAAAANLSLSDYLLHEINEIASRPQFSEVLRRAASRSGGAKGADIVAAVRAERDRDEA